MQGVLTFAATVQIELRQTFPSLLSIFTSFRCAREGTGQTTAMAFIAFAHLRNGENLSLRGGDTLRDSQIEPQRETCSTRRLNIRNHTTGENRHRPRPISLSIHRHGTDLARKQPRQTKLHDTDLRKLQTTPLPIVLDKGYLFGVRVAKGGSGTPLLLEAGARALTLEEAGKSIAEVLDGLLEGVNGSFCQPGMLCTPGGEQATQCRVVEGLPFFLVRFFTDEEGLVVDPTTTPRHTREEPVLFLGGVEAIAIGLQPFHARSIARSTSKVNRKYE